MGDDRKTEIERFARVVEALHTAFPGLLIEVADVHPHVDALAEIPQQAGLDFCVGIDLQNADELHLTVGDYFWAEWFPCGDDEVFRQFIDAVTGLISGDYRIVESFVLGTAAVAQLERPDGKGGWKPITRWRTLRSLLPVPRTRRVLRNISRTFAAS